ncbi:hypothetical protein J2S13_002750 [Oikeobacillus pervagus]|uniref:Uncharacterized protein n=1 Tax=Oikeobacillus pervagus TaxID=1325931 RepID=A0AAJ1T5N1_9BACI|nr:hypothetical protein [Oikeobacillus pervagus]
MKLEKGLVYEEINIAVVFEKLWTGDKYDWLSLLTWIYRSTL